MKASEQLGLLDQWEQQTAANAAERRRMERIEAHRQSRRACWPEWAGPAAGELCDVAGCTVRKEDGTTIYAYTEQCRLLEQRPDGSWLAVIEMGTVHGKPWPGDGTRLILEDTNIWPPTRELWKARRGES